MKLQEKTIKVLDYERLNNSYYGNPCYYLFMETTEGDFLRGKTATNSAAGYSDFSYFKYQGTHLKIKFHYTKKGNLIIDYIERV